MLSFFVFLLAITAISHGDDFSEGNQKFSAALYKELIVDNDDSVLVSPFAIEILAAIAQSGSNGATGEEIRNSLYFPESQAATEKALKSLISEVEDDAPTFLLANSISVDSKYEINADFKAAASDVYQAKTSSGSSGVSLSADLVFRANFATSFKLLSEKQAALGSGKKSETMFLKASTLNYAESEDLDAQILEIPFDIDTISLTIVLPNKESGLGVLEKNMETVLATPNFSKVAVDVTLPTFRIATKTNFASILQNLGMKKAFDSKSADLSGIAGDAGDLYLKEVNQMTYLNFSPTGINADIATQESLPISSTAAEADATFKADHPFVFYVKVRDVVVLVGRVLDL